MGKDKKIFREKLMIITNNKNKSPNVIFQRVRTLEKCRTRPKNPHTNSYLKTAELNHFVNIFYSI